MKFLPRMLTGIVLGSLGLSVLLTSSTAANAAEAQWRSPDEAPSSRLAPPQNEKIVRRTATSKTRQVSHTQDVRQTRSQKATTKRAPARLASAQAAQPAKKVRLTKSAVRKAAAYTPSTRQMAPWQQQKNASFGLPGRGAVRTAQRTTRSSAGYRMASTEDAVILEPEEVENLGDAFSSSCSTCSDGSCGGSCGDSCGGNCDNTSSTCGSCNWDTSCCLPFALPAIDNLTFSGGVEGFKGPADLGQNGNFGFGVGFNLAGPLRRCDNIGYQIGARYVGSNFNGEQVGVAYEDDTRSQLFITGGIFRRASSCCPWQWGLAYDYLRDKYHYDAEMSQVRIELSRMGCFGNELGVMVMQKSKNSYNVASSALRGAGMDLEPQNQFLFFIRRRFDTCGEGRLWGGVSGYGDGIVGGDLRMPLTGSVAATAGFNYLFSDEDSNSLAQQGDSYGIGVNLVWHPRCSAREAGSNPLRPLFEVANNMTFMLRRP